MNSNSAFVEITFSDDVKKYFHRVVKAIVPSDYLYYSPVVPRIKGDMTSTLHCTLFYGLDPKLQDDESLKEIINSSKVNEIKLGELFFINGYKNLYKVLCVRVLDEENNLFDLSNNIREFSKENFEFKPHLTLAYVQSDFELPQNFILEKSILEVNSIKFSLHLNI